MNNILKAFGDKDLRLRSVGKDIRKREAKRRLMDIDIKAGQPGSDLCQFTTYSSASKQRDMQYAKPSRF